MAKSSAAAKPIPLTRREKRELSLSSAMLGEKSTTKPRAAKCNSLVERPPVANSRRGHDIRQCGDVQDYSRDDGGQIVQYSLHGADNQRWMFEPADNGFYYIVSVLSGKCLDVSGGRSDDAAEIIQYHVHGEDNQKWYLSPVRDGFITLLINAAVNALT